MISFIVPLFNHLDQSRQMLVSLLNTLPAGLDYEVILIDDGSTDGTREWLRGLSLHNVQVILNETNLGYAGSNNKAVAMAKGDILGLLNNDLILLDGWLEPMLQVLCDPALDAGIVGNIQYKVLDNAIDHAGIGVSHLAKIDHIRETPPAGRVFNRVFAVTGACCLVSRQDFLAVGGFDEQFYNGGEDVDLCLKLGVLNKHAYVANTSHVMHHVSLTRDPNSMNNEKNSRLLFSKWRPAIFQEVKNAWMRLLDSPFNPDLGRFSLNASCFRTPHTASLMLADSVMRREEVWWRELLEGVYPDFDKLIEKVDGFYWDKQHPCAYIQGKAWLTVAQDCAVRNISISGEVFGLKPSDSQCPDEVEIIVEINGIQERCWAGLPVGDFDLRIEYPVFSRIYPSLISIELGLRSRNILEAKPVLAPCNKAVRFSRIKFDEQLVLDLMPALKQFHKANKFAPTEEVVVKGRLG